MSDLAATNCGCNEGNGCCSIIWILLLLSCCGNGSGFFGGNSCDNNNCSCIWIILLLFFCGGCNDGIGFNNNGCGCGCGC